ncbi:MAG: hypothetical protein K9M08_17980 [Pirellula sp.]|nr:hypothetical protein [Pirellula sp.]
MRFIDFEGRKPTDKDIHGWEPWTEEAWKKWLADSEEHLREVKRRHESGDIAARNAYIDSKAKHWGKLKKWLFALSNGKCWFTEGRDICSHEDVEHFRPKKLVLNLDNSEDDGYWWLAFDYKNYRASGNVPNRKKGNWFPIHEDSRRSKFDKRSEESETIVLIDPTNPQDVGLIAFNEEGNAIPNPKLIDPWDRLRAEKSIEWLKLNEHDDLPEERRKVWQKISRLLEEYYIAKAAYKPGINPAPYNTMKEKLREIKERTRADAELSVTAMWCVEFRNDRELHRLVAC